MVKSEDSKIEPSYYIRRESFNSWSETDSENDITAALEPNRCNIGASGRNNVLEPNTNKVVEQVDDIESIREDGKETDISPDVRSDEINEDILSISSMASSNGRDRCSQRTRSTVSQVFWKPILGFLDVDLQTFEKIRSTIRKLIESAPSAYKERILDAVDDEDTQFRISVR